MAVKFPLKMADGATVRTIEELREHFNLTSVLAYYRDGRLKKWLEDRYYTEEENQISALNSDSDNIARELCVILGVNYSETEIEHIDLGDISQRNVRLEQLKRFTADDAILETIDRVAFTQNELLSLLDNQVKEIYLCGGHFTIPGNTGGITYIGVNNPAIEFSGESVAAGIDIRNLEFDIDSYVGDYVDGSCEGELFFAFFHDNLTLGMKLLRAAADAGSAKMQTFLGNCYRDFTYNSNCHGIVEFNWDEAFKWYLKAVSQGYTDAMVCLGNYYLPNHCEATKWYRKAADQGNARAQIIMGDKYRCGEGGVKKDHTEALKWYLKAANQGCVEAQLILGDIYTHGKDGFKKDISKALEWYKKAAEQGSEEAQTHVTYLYRKQGDLSGAIAWYKDLAKSGDADILDSIAELYREEENYSEAEKWENEAVNLYKKVAEQGDAEAQFHMGSHCLDDGDYEEAYRWLSLAADQGNSSALDFLYVHFRRTHGDEVIKRLQEKAKQGDGCAEFRILGTVSKGLKKSSKWRKVHKRIEAEILGIRGFLVWDYFIKNEISFESKYWAHSLFISKSKEETEIEWARLVDEYGIK